MPSLHVFQKACPPSTRLALARSMHALSAALRSASLRALSHVENRARSVESGPRSREERGADKQRAKQSYNRG